MKNLIFWEKYRPKSVKNMVLIPRIESYVGGEIDSNMIFYGTPGTGKTTIAKIIASNHNSLTLNGKLGIDVLSDKIKNHFESLDLAKKGQTKLVFIDEFDRATINLMDSMKSFIEDYPYARFIFTTNHIDKITIELRSRFNCISFDPISSQEREFLYKKQVSYLKAISKREEFNFDSEKKTLEKIVNKNFPDLRSAIVQLQHVIKSGDESSVSDEINSDKNDLFQFILNKDMNPNRNYDYVMNNYFITYDDAFKFLSRPFFEYLMETQPDILMSRGALILKTQKEYNETFETTLDPLIHLINYIMDLKNCLK